VSGEGKYAVMLDTLINQMKDRKNVRTLFLPPKRAEIVGIITSVDVMEWRVMDAFQSQAEFKYMLLDVLP
jgi:hypothetical protein